MPHIFFYQGSSYCRHVARDLCGLALSSQAAKTRKAEFYFNIVKHIASPALASVWALLYITKHIFHFSFFSFAHYRQIWSIIRKWEYDRVYYFTSIPVAPKDRAFSYLAFLEIA